MLRARALDASTWADFAGLVERHGGLFGGCWCIGFHRKPTTVAENRTEKEARVREGRAHAALVYDGATCVGWCQFGSPEELPRIKHGRAYQEGLSEPPDWRITCFFAAKGHRRTGVASAALAGIDG